MKGWIYKWLPIFFGCHCRSDRSFFFRGKQFPICARCTGELLGFLWALPALFLVKLPLWVFLCMLVPMIIDGAVQLKTSYESTNLRRLITGFLFGWGLVSFLAITLRGTFLFGYRLGERLRS